MKNLKKIILIVSATMLLAGCGTKMVNIEPTTEDMENALQEDAGDSENGNESEINANSNSDEADATWETIKAKGFADNGESILSFSLHTEDAKDCGDYYEVPVDMYEGVTIPSNLAVNEEYTFNRKFADGTDQSITIIREENYEFPVADEDGYAFYSYDSADDGTNIVLYCDSDDRVETFIGSGVVKVTKGTKIVIAITQESWDYTIGDSDEFFSWFNGVKFDDNGYITQLTSYGD